MDRILFFLILPTLVLGGLFLGLWLLYHAVFTFPIVGLLLLLYFVLRDINREDSRRID